MCVLFNLQDHINHVHDAVTDYMKKTRLPFSGIVHNAGLGYHAPLETHNLDDIRRMFDVNFFGAIHLTQRFLPLIRQEQVSKDNLSLIYLNVPACGFRSMRLSLISCLVNRLASFL